MLPVLVLVAVLRHLTVKPKGGRIYISSWLSGSHKQNSHWLVAHGDAPDLSMDQKAESLTGSRTKL